LLFYNFLLHNSLSKEYHLLQLQLRQKQKLKAERRVFSHWLCQTTLLGRSLIFLDEVGFKLSQRICNGRSRRGERAISTTPGIRTRNISVMAAMTKNG
jgi:hypothetical protein